jgi:hypothetical protein
VLACLREAGALPDAETVWKELRGILGRHGVKVAKMR